MAGDWLKLEVITPDKPELIRMAATLRIDQDAVFGKLFRVWAWADQNSVDGSNLIVTEAFLDRLTSRRGFAVAMRAAGWLTGEDGALCFPNFARHNGATAKARAENNRRVTKHRAECNANSVTSALQKALPEKRREEEEKNIPEEPTAPAPKAAPKRAASDASDEEWLSGLEKKDCYRPLSIRTQLGLAQTWAENNHRQCTRQFFVNWLSRALEKQRVVSPTPQGMRAKLEDKDKL